MRPRGTDLSCIQQLWRGRGFHQLMNIVVQYNSKAERPNSEGQNLR